TAAAGYVLGPGVAQLNRDHDYAPAGGTSNQLATYADVGLLGAPLPAPPAALAKLADPADGSAPLDDRARAYLDTNCSNCHRPGGPVPGSLDFRAVSTPHATNACNATPQAGNLGIPDAALLVPG